VNSMQVVRFLVRDTHVAIPVEQVREVVGIGSPASVFHAPPFVAGLMNVRGQAFPVLDLAPLMGLAGGGTGCRRPEEAASHVLLVESGPFVAGILASRPVDIVDVGKSGEVPPAAGVPCIAALVSVAREENATLLVLDAGRLFDLPEVAALRLERRPITMPA